MPSHGSLVDRLTRRELVVLEAVSTGMSNKEIAEELSLAPNTIVNCLTSVYLKLDINSSCNARVTATLMYLTAKGFLYRSGHNGGQGIDMTAQETNEAAKALKA